MGGTPHRLKIPGGESLDEIKKRSWAVLSDILTKHNGQIVAIVSHRVVGKVLICAMLGLDNSHFWRIRHDTCGITIFEYSDKGFTLTLHNDTCHLRGILEIKRDIDF